MTAGNADEHSEATLAPDQTEPQNNGHVYLSPELPLSLPSELRTVMHRLREDWQGDRFHAIAAATYRFCREGGEAYLDGIAVWADSRGMNEEFITEAMAHGTKQWAQRKEEPEPPAKPTRKSRHNSYNQKPGAADVTLTPDASKAILRLDEWLKRDLEPPTLVMGEWLSTTSRVMLYAPTGLGKSMLGIGLGMRAAAGNGFLHWQGHGPYRVLYIDGEMSRALLKDRLAGEADRLGSIPETFFALSHEDIENFAPLNTEEGQKTIDTIIEQIGGIDLLFLDNIMCLVSGDMKEEESWRQTVPWQLSLTKRRIGQFWLHHTGHDESKGYGTKTKEWQLDTVLKMEHVERVDAHISFAIHFQKKRLCTPRNRHDFRDVILALVDDRWELSEAEEPTIKPAKPEADTVRKFRSAFTEALDTLGRNIRIRGAGPQVKAVDVSHVRTEFNKRHAVGEKDIKKRSDAQYTAFKRALSKLSVEYPSWVDGEHEWIWKVTGP
jgi:hypothetical protein